jgi:hypothetical protein
MSEQLFIQSSLKQLHATLQAGSGGENVAGKRAKASGFFGSHPRRPLAEESIRRRGLEPASGVSAAWEIPPFRSL